MFNLLIESLIIGIIMCFIGNVILKITKDENNKKEEKDFTIQFIIIGFITNIVVYKIDLNKYQCDKKCMHNICQLSTINF